MSQLNLEEGKRLLSEVDRAHGTAWVSPPGENPAWKAYDAAIGAFNGWVKRHGVALLSAAEEAEKLRELRLATTTSDTFATLPQHQRAQAEAIAQMLRTATGSYRGSETDALTDACAIVIAAQFAPPLGDNHHNARACPYCTPSEPQETP